MAKKKKARPISKLKKDLDKWFSLYVRLRYATTEGMTQCVTCGDVKHYKSMHCGHFMSRVHHSTRWHEDNCEVQCIGCNLYKQGQQYLFSVHIDNKHGEGTADELEFLSRTTVKYMRCDYEEQIEHYKNTVRQLINDKQIEI